MSPPKESRTEALLRQLGVDKSFLDPRLPKGFFSNSQYNSWLICGKAYEFKYVQQITGLRFHEPRQRGSCGRGIRAESQAGGLSVHRR